MDHRPIADYALLSDCRSAALVSSQGSIDWLCFPDFDSPSVFGRLLDAQAGHWSICTQETVKASRRYVEDAMVLQTTFESEHGTAVLTDAMALGPQERGHDLGQDAPHCLLRSIECTAGEIRVDFDLLHVLNRAGAATPEAHRWRASRPRRIRASFSVCTASHAGS